MTTTFYKYQGTGNDFIIIDNRLQIVNKNDTKRIEELCDRRFGIGADGFILLENDEFSDFKMVYYNADGKESSMCGNGGRCIVAFANYLGIIDKVTKFSAIDGLHNASIDNGFVSLQMGNVEGVKVFEDHTFLDTGSPHHVEMVSEIKNLDVKTKGSEIRYGASYGAEGSNVNFVEPISDNLFSVRTYERGVEDETFSCGTGVTAVALAMHANNKTKTNTVFLDTLGGKLQVNFKPSETGYKDVWLIGPAVQVFKGELTW
ncbi:diaminopimelate epimerase [Winogradskyella alexanderae]|uniref:Diaminopimelate epimerase n=1 Tax=Winogradskyella alexanderae TaxID=2877123 RepID=A0ABS7XUA0_9FLAO|nr:diaminopimelate epimerase [Winogradskyella alexanderae]MCA0133049.1 diaminopimelate epimerase [Winogradskyella alexanderae]